VADFGHNDPDELRRALVAECGAALPGWTIKARILADI
jgi:hypothetical protein